MLRRSIRTRRKPLQGWRGQRLVSTVLPDGQIEVTVDEGWAADVTPMPKRSRPEPPVEKPPQLLVPEASEFREFIDCDSSFSVDINTKSIVHGFMTIKAGSQKPPTLINKARGMILTHITNQIEVATSTAHTTYSTVTLTRGSLLVHKNTSFMLTNNTQQDTVLAYTFYR